MSEYQYYEFRAVDKPLSREDMAALRSVSSRGEISASSYVNEYHWGNFKGDPDEWMERYFDAFLYYANWGTKTLMLRLPKSILTADMVSPYCLGDSVGVQTTQEHTIITFGLEPYDGPDDVMDDEASLGSMIGLRAELACGDLRSFYLGWLITCEGGYDEDDADDEEIDDEGFEPPVPPGLNELTASQESFVEFFGIDRDLLTAAASASTPMPKRVTNSDQLELWISNLPDKEKNVFLLQVMDDLGSRVALELRSRFHSETSPGEDPTELHPRRTPEELFTTGKAIRDDRMRKEREVKEAARQRRLDDFAGRLPAIWNQVEGHVEAKKTSEYDLAVRLLLDLRELFKRGDFTDFGDRVTGLRERHPTKRAFLERLDKHNL